MERVRELAAGHDLVPVVAELLADCDTPVSALLRLGTDAECFLLESVEGGEHLARWSFLGRDPIRTVTCRDGIALTEGGGERQRRACADPLAAVEEEIARWRVAPLPGLQPPMRGGAVGVLCYEAAGAYERLPRTGNDPLRLPDAHFGVYQTLIVFDHVAQRMTLVTHVDTTAGDVTTGYAAAVDRLSSLRDRLRHTPLPAPEAFAATTIASDPEQVVNWPRAAFLRAVALCKEHILAGDIYQVQLSRRFSPALHASPFAVYRALRSVNPSPYMFFLNTAHGAVVGASPEMLIRVVGSDVQYHPIAGTRRRGRDAADDAAMEAELVASEKERAEHLMLVDLGRNDLGRVCRTGSVRVTELMEVERYSHVMHLVSSISGTLDAGKSAVDALRACFPAGTVTGAPKLRAIEIIAELEPEDRGVYAGAVGYLGFGGDLDTAIALRTLLIRDGVAHAQAAAGIVADSSAEEEALEIDNKTAALLLAVERANAGVAQ